MSTIVATAPESRVHFEPSAGDQPFRLCILDFTGVHDEGEALDVIDAAERRIALAARMSLRVLTDVEGSRISLGIVGALERLARANAPYVQRSAIVGLSLAQRLVLRQVRRLTGRDIREFTTREDALAYLRG